LSPNELQEKFGEYKLTVTDAEGDSAQLISHKTSEFGRYAEVTLESFQNYIRFCDHNGVDGERRFNKFHSFLQGTARVEWIRLTDHGHEHWDGMDTSTNAQFRKALEAWIIMMTECRDPGNLQQQKLMGIAYKTFKQEGYCNTGVTLPTCRWRMGISTGRSRLPGNGTVESQYGGDRVFHSFLNRMWFCLNRH